MKMQVSWRGLREEQVLGTRPDHREQVHRDRTGSWSLGPEKVIQNQERWIAVHDNST